MVKVRISEMTRVDIQKALDRGFRTIVFAVGSNEQHGPHLPTCTDSLIGDALANKVTAKLGMALQAPSINVGCSDHHMVFPGAISLRFETLRSLIRDYCFSLAHQGFKNIVVLPSHGGNFEVVRQVTDDLNHSLEKAKIISYTDLKGLLELLAGFSSKHGITAAESGAHAGESETSMVLAIRKDLVDMKVTERGFMGKFEDIMGQMASEGIKAVSENGVIGDPRKADARNGEQYLELWADKMVEYIRKQVTI